MKTQITNLSLAIAVIASSVAFTSEANAQQRAAVPQTGQAQTYVNPGVMPIQQNPFYFGMNVELKRSNWGGTTLRVVSVTPGSPAHQAGLEIGDEIRRVNGRGFHNATDSFDAVRKLNRYVVGTNRPAPAASGAAAALVIGPPQVSSIAHMIVRNVRNGQNVSLNVYPTRAYGVGAPAAMSAGG